MLFYGGLTDKIMAVVFDSKCSNLVKLYKSINKSNSQC